jgi:UDP-glucuronate 4-epimerase
MKVLVTGAAGFIGSYLSRELLRRGDDVIGIDNFNEYYPRECKEFNLDLVRMETGIEPNTYSKDDVGKIHEKLLEYRNLKPLEETGQFYFEEGDIVDKDFLQMLFDKYQIDAVVHLAAMAGVPYVNLLEMCKDRDIKKFIFGSSSSVYGGRTDVPFKEEDDVNKPISTYAATKRMGEIICYTYNYLYKIPIISARIFGPIYGPLQRFYGMAAQRFIKQVYQDKPITVYGDGSMGRDSTYIDDEVDGLIKCLDSDIDYDIINIGTGNPVTVMDLANNIIELFGKGAITYLEKPPTEVPVTFADISKAKDKLGYDPKTDFKEGLRRQVEVFNMMPDWYKSMEETI